MMCHNRLLIILCLFFLTLVPLTQSYECQNSLEERSTFLWSIKSPVKGTRHSFLFGTIHVGYDRVWNSVSIKLKQILSRVETLVLELALHDASTIEKLIECKQLGPDQTLQELLPTSLFVRLKKYFSYFRQLSRLNATNELNTSQLISAWEKRKPVWLLFLMYQLGEEQSKQSNVQMLDAYLAHKSQQFHKKLYSIETPEEQCNPLLSIDQEQIIFAINYTLSYLEWSRRNPHRLTSKKSTIEDLIQMYKCGDLKVARLEGWRLQETGFTLNSDLDEQAKKLDEQLKHDIIDQRNARMAMRANDLIKANPQQSYLFALGAGHFNGEYSLINILKNYGYIIEPITEETNVDDYFLGQISFKNFNELWIRNNDKQDDSTTVDDEQNTRRIYYIWILFIAILLFIFVIHKITQYVLLRVMIKTPKVTYDQVPSSLPNYI